MARIRTVKPETWTSESLAEVSLTAERTFLGLLTQADDHGRFRDNAAVIAGVLWPLRAEHTAVHVEDDLQQLADAGLICRYGGCNSRRFLHIVTWAKHQKIDKPSQSRAPACPEHHAEERCGVCKGTCTEFADISVNSPGGLTEASPNPPTRTPTREAGTSASTSSTSGEAKAIGAAGFRPARSAPAEATDDAGQNRFGEDSPKPPRSVDEGSTPGSRILDPGSSFPTGRAAPVPARGSAQELVGEYVAGCPQRPPGEVIGHLGRVVKKLLDEGIEAGHVRAGLERFRAKPMHPSVLPSLVNEAMNAPVGRLGRPEGRHTVPAHRAWANPAHPATAYAEEL